MRLARETFHPYRPQREVNVGFGVPEPPPYHSTMDLAFQQEYPETKNKRYFLFLGRIHPKKGVDLLIRAYSSISRSTNAAHPGSFPNLVIAGPGLDTPYGQSMQALASKTCSPGSVFWPGMLSGDAKWAALYNCEAFVLASHQENFGVAIVEALACGKPVLISKQINIWREIEEDRAGLIDADTLDGAENLLREWRELSPEKVAAMKQSARLCYENRFSIVHTVQNLMKVVADKIPQSQTTAPIHDEPR
jgi:glycosyltransferase involved in cell wall biosynthesis